MSRTETCRCDTPHVERVQLPPLHILGAGTYWRAAKPGGVYLAGHGLHFYTQADAEDYAFGSAPARDSQRQRTERPCLNVKLRSASPAPCTK